MTSGPVYQGDNIRTGARGEAQIRLMDNTRLVVGPNSLMVVDDFIYDGGAKAQKVTLNAVRGAFRFITGSSRKDAYEIKTPTATIGVRGTQFDFTIGRGGDLNFALFEGQARICQPGRQCVVVSGACNVVVAPRRQPVRRPTSIEERTKLLTDMFPYVASQTKLRSDFRVDTSSCSVRKASIAPGQTLPVTPRANGVVVVGAASPAAAAADDRLDRAQSVRTWRRNEPGSGAVPQQLAAARLVKRRDEQSRWRRWEVAAGRATVATHRDITNSPAGIGCDRKSRRRQSAAAFFVWPSDRAPTLRRPGLVVGFAGRVRLRPRMEPGGR